jgi:hypothetical protein
LSFATNNMPSTVGRTNPSSSSLSKPSNCSKTISPLIPLLQKL